MSPKVLFAGWFVLSVLQSCSVHTVNDVASALYLKPDAQITRQRQLSLSHLSHVGFYIDSQPIRQNPSYMHNPLLETRLNELQQGVQLAFAATFANYSKMDKPKSPSVGIDFIVYAQLINMTFTEIEDPVLEDKDKEHKDKEKGEGDEAASDIAIPTDYLEVKLVLKDARSRQLIDVAYLKTRSGQLDYTEGYAAFAKYSIGQYLKAITQ